MAEETTTMTVRLPLHLKERLEALSKSTDRSKSWLASDAIRAYLELQEWQVTAIKEGLREAEEGDFASAEEVKAVIDRWTKNNPQ